MKNVFYFKDINNIGGVESMFYYLSCLYKNMVVYYKTADTEQVKRLAQNVEVRKYKDGEIIKCDKFFCNYNPDIINNVEANEYIHIIHCDYKKVKFNPIMSPKFTKYIGVSKLVCRSFEEITGVKAECIYNPIAIKKVERQKQNDGKVHLITAMRWSKEKGRERIEKMAHMLDQANVNFEWVIYTNRHSRFTHPKIIFKQQKLDIIDEIAKADFLVQLSDHEAYCYSVVEALCCGVPVIVTDLPVYKEIGLKRGENAIITSINLFDLNIKAIEQGLPDFEYQPPKSEWGKYLDNDTDYNPNDLVEVKAKRNYTDVELGRKIHIGERFKITKARASYLEAYPVNYEIIGLIERV